MPHIDCSGWSAAVIEAQRDALREKGACPNVVMSWLSQREIDTLEQARRDDMKRKALQRDCLKGGSRGHAARLK